MADSKPTRWSVRRAKVSGSSKPVLHPGSAADRARVDIVASNAHAISFGGDGEKKKVLISVSEDDLKIIDAQADRAGMSRSAYLVAMGRQGSASLFEAIETLRKELDSFSVGGEPWKQEVFRLTKAIARNRDELMETKKDFDDLKNKLVSTVELLGSMLPLVESVATISPSESVSRVLEQIREIVPKMRSTLARL